MQTPIPGLSITGANESLGAGMRGSLRYILGALTLLMPGCAYNDQFDNRIGRYDLAAAQSRDAMILTNVIRASHAEPLSFVQLGQISGSNTVGAQMGLPSLILGPLVPAATSAATHALQSESIFGANPAGGSGYVGNSASLSGSTNFQVTPSESKDFYVGLLHEVNPQILQLFIQQGVAREVLFYLFTDKLIVERGGVKMELRNDPLDREKFPEFQKFVSLAMKYGLSSEPVPVPGGTSREAKKPMLLSSEMATGGILLKPGKSEESKKYQLCFDLPRNVTPAANAPICGDSTVAAEEHTVSYKDHEGVAVKLQVLPRSAFAIFQYLGRIVAAGEAGRILLKSPEAIDQPPLQDEVLFVVTNASSGPCYLNVDYEGLNYCVPAEGAANTKRILGLLVQLIALNTSVEDIAITPNVRIIQ
jgi:hypothetical protein